MEKSGQNLPHTQEAPRSCLTQAHFINITSSTPTLGGGTGNEPNMVGVATTEAAATNPTPPLPAERKKRKVNASGSRRTSIVWDHFIRLPDHEVTEPTAKCKYCPKTYYCDTKLHGTSNMLAHLKVCKKYSYASHDPNQTILTFGSSGCGESSDLIAASQGFNMEPCGVEEGSLSWEMAESEVEVIHSWSTPKSLNTTLMYSFSQRDDVEVFDEPLYANFLRVSGVHRPYRDELLSKMESDGNKVVKDIVYGRPGNKKFRFCKHMSKQKVLGLPEDLMKRGKHFILIRNPLDILQSFDEVVPPSFFELGLAELICIYNELCEIGKPPPVVDVAELQQDPEATLRALCNDLEIPFQPAMLSWEAGPKPIDGLWAPWWYKTVHKSTGFKEERKYPQPFPFSLYNLLEQSLPLYNMLRHHVKNKSCLLGPPLPPPNLPVLANEKLLAWVGDEIVPRESAKVSVFDSVVQGGDSVWEGLRVYKGKIFKLEEHLDRMFDSAKALAFENLPTRDEIKEAIFKTLIRNGMFDNSHIRLSLTRGKKVTSGMSPALNLYGCTLIVLAEWKPPVYDNEHGIVLVTATTRRNSPNNLDSKIHHNNLLNNILAKIEGNNAKADDAIMLDKDGYVSETNATNIFIVKKGRVLTPHADYCLPGITRATVMDLVKEQFILEERRISLSEVHTADEIWTTGTMGELSPVVKVDGRTIGDGKVGPVTKKLQAAYKKLTEQSGVPIPNYLESLKRFLSLLLEGGEKCWCAATATNLSFFLYGL